MSRTLLGGLAPREFLARHWQKKPLLVRGALPRFADPVDLAAVRALARRDDVESRLVVRDGARWRLEHGPLPRAALARCPSATGPSSCRGSTTSCPRPSGCSRSFAFVPYARLDDVMVSYAAPRRRRRSARRLLRRVPRAGHGRRRWRISTPARSRGRSRARRSRCCAASAPEEEWVLEPGDMLYLPPGVAHDGVALEPCMTYSIGFRAPAPRRARARVPRLDAGARRPRRHVPRPRPRARARGRAAFPTT